jgi:CubicO group peptidase (beta-lactamase class C family)
LQHRSGLRDSEDGLEAFCAEGCDNGDDLAKIIEKRLQHVPWDDKDPPRYHYSNLGMTIVALVLERAAHVPFAQLVKQLVFVPLGMKHSSFHLRETLAMPNIRLAHPHAYGKQIDHYGVAEWPAAGLRSTLHDLLQMLREFTGDERKF